MKLVINGRIVEVSGGGSSISSFPKGIIAIWSGSLDDIPTGWQLCDGTNGTPDLRDKFVLGAGEVHQIGEEGGSESVTLTVDQLPAHSHKYVHYSSGRSTANGTSTPSVVTMTPSSSIPTEQTGGSEPHPNMPPYYALAYIMHLQGRESMNFGYFSGTFDAKLYSSSQYSTSFTIDFSSLTPQISTNPDQIWTDDTTAIGTLSLTPNSSSTYIFQILPNGVFKWCWGGGLGSSVTGSWMLNSSMKTFMVQISTKISLSDSNPLHGSVMVYRPLNE